MSTTTIRLSDELKARITAAAELAGMTPHGFILEAIAEKTELEEKRADFNSVADARYAKIVDSGETVSWDEMRRYLEKRLVEPATPKPTPAKLQAKVRSKRSLMR